VDGGQDRHHGEERSIQSHVAALSKRRQRAHGWGLPLAGLRWARTPFTKKQGEYLAFIADYQALHRRAPAESDFVAYFKVSPPSVHQMIVGLEKRRLIARQPGAPRSIKLLVSPDDLPGLPESAARPSDEALTELVLATGYRVAANMIDRPDGRAIDDEDLAPLVACAASAVAEQFVTLGATKDEVRLAKERILAYATEVYCDLCARQDPEGASFAEDSTGFRRLLGAR